MTCKARSHAYASDSPRLKRDTVHVAPPISASSPTTTTPHASSQPAKRRSSDGDHVLDFVLSLGTFVHGRRCGDETSFRQSHSRESDRPDLRPIPAGT